MANEIQNIKLWRRGSIDTRLFRYYNNTITSDTLIKFHNFTTYSILSFTSDDKLSHTKSSQRRSWVAQEFYLSYNNKLKYIS